jgi:hypothetical protein
MEDRNDIVFLGNGLNTVIYGANYGIDTIKNFGNDDKIIINANISKDNLILKLVGNDLKIALKEESKTFEELTNVLIIENYLNSQKEGLIQFSNNQTFKLYELLNNTPTTGDDRLEYGDEDIVIH